MHFQFCPICGSKLILKEAGDDGMVPYCEPCAKMWFDMFSSCIIALVANEYHEIALLHQPRLSDRGVFVSGYITPGNQLKTLPFAKSKKNWGLMLRNLSQPGPSGLKSTDS